MLSIYQLVFGGTPVAPAIPTYLPLAFAVNTVLGWPLESNITSPAVAAWIDATATAGGLTLQFSDARQVGTGYTTIFNNVGANTFSVLDAQGNVLVAPASGAAWILVLADNSTLQGTWRTLQLGAGVSNANAAALAGAGLKAISTTLNERIVINPQAVNYTIGSGTNQDRASCVEWTGGSGGTFSSLTAATLGSDWFCYIKNSGSGVVTFTPGSGLINGSASQTFNPNDSAIVATDGTNFFTIGLGQAVASSFNFVTISLAGASGTVILTGAQLNRVSYKFTGALAGNTTVQVPASIQQYWVDNETTGAFTLTISAGGAGSTFTVPQASRTILYCDGLNIVQAISSGAIQFADGTAAAPSITFASDLGLGFYKAGTDVLGISTAGAQRATLNASGQWTMNTPAAAGPTMTVNAYNVSAGNLCFLGQSTTDGDIFQLQRTGGTHNPTFFVVVTDSTNITQVSGSGTLTLGGGGLTSMTMNSTGNVSIGAPGSGVALTVTGIGGTAAVSAGVVNIGNSVAFGAGGTITSGSALLIGTTAAVTTSLWADNNLGITVTTTGGVQFPSISTTASAANAFLDSTNSNNLLRSTSSIRYKTDVEYLPADTAARMMRLRPVRYHSKAAADDPALWWYGLIAEEVFEVEPRLVHYDVDGRPDGVQYDRLSVLLLAEVQRLRQELDAHRRSH